MRGVERGTKLLRIKWDQARELPMEYLAHSKLHITYVVRIIITPQLEDQV